MQQQENQDIHLKTRNHLLADISAYFSRLGEIGKKIVEADEAQKEIIKPRYAREVKNLVKATRRLSDRIGDIDGLLPEDFQLPQPLSMHSVIASIMSYQLTITLEDFPSAIQALEMLANLLTPNGDSDAFYQHLLSNLKEIYQGAAKNRLREMTDSLNLSEIPEKFYWVLMEEGGSPQIRLEQFTQVNVDQDFNHFYQHWLNQEADRKLKQSVDWLNALTLNDLQDDKIQTQMAKAYDAIKQIRAKTHDERIKVAMSVLMRVYKTAYNETLSEQSLGILRAAVVSTCQLLYVKLDEEANNVSLEAYEQTLSEIEQIARDHARSAVWRGVLEALLIFLGIVILAFSLIIFATLLSLALPLAAAATLVFWGMTFTVATAKLIAGITLGTGVILSGLTFFGAGVASNHSRQYSHQSKGFHELQTLMEPGKELSIEALKKKATQALDQVFSILPQFSNSEHSIIKENWDELESSLSSYMSHVRERTQITLAHRKQVSYFEVLDEEITPEDLLDCIKEDVQKQMGNFNKEILDTFLRACKGASNYIADYHHALNTDLQQNRTHNSDSPGSFFNKQRPKSSEDGLLEHIYLKGCSDVVEYSESIHEKMNNIRQLYNRLTVDSCIFSASLQDILNVPGQTDFQKFFNIQELIKNNQSEIPDHYIYRTIVSLAVEPCPKLKAIQKMEMGLKLLRKGIKEIQHKKSDILIEIINEPEPLIQEKKHKKPHSQSYWWKGVLGIVWGVGLLVLSILSLNLPVLIVYGIVGATTLVTLFLGAEIYWKGLKKLFKEKKLTMNLLYMISTLTIVVLSVLSVFIAGLPLILEAATLILGLWYIGKIIEHSLKKKVTEHLNMRDCVSKTVSRIREVGLVDPLVPLEDLKPEDIIMVAEGEVIPVDGVCLQDCLLSTTKVNGSYEPQYFKAGEAILAGMQVTGKSTQIQVTKSFQDSYLCKLDDHIKKAGNEKAPIELLTDKVLQFFIPGLLIISILSAVTIWFLFTPALAITCAISVLVSACPCALGLITPLAVKIGMNKAADKGVNFKNGKALQAGGRVKDVVFDLNGTLTTGTPRVSKFRIIDNSVNEYEFFQWVERLERGAKHPTATAIHEFAAQRIESVMEESDAVAIDDSTHHSGILGNLQGEVFIIGNKTLLSHYNIGGLDEIDFKNNTIYLAKGNKLIGAMEIEDPLREDAQKTVEGLRALGMEVHVCTGASKEAALYYGDLLGIPETHIQADCVATEGIAGQVAKTNYIQGLQQQGRKVAMIGDAANDAPAIVTSDFGIAIQSRIGDEVTQQEAGAIIQNQSLMPILTAFEVAQQATRNIIQNLLISLSYNVLVTLVAAGLLLFLGISLNPIIGIGLMVLETTVILLNLYRFKQTRLSFEEKALNAEELVIQTNPTFNEVQYAQTKNLDIEPTAKVKEEFVSSPEVVLAT